jgi:phosphoglycerate dehydrogenase-like enzyme
MMDLNVLVLASDPEIYSAPVRERFPTAKVFGCSDYESLGLKIAAHSPGVALVSRLGGAFPREVLLNAPSLKWVQCASAGVDYLLPLTERVRVTSASGIHDGVVSDYILAAVLMFNLHFPLFIHQQLERVWQPRELVPMEGQTLIVLGLGSIGRLTARKAKKLGMRIIGVKARPKGSEDGIDEVVGPSDLVDVVARADALAVCVPKTSATRGLVGREVLKRMKRGATLVNVSRGGIVDETALLEALNQGGLGGAVLDVFEQEPLPKSSPLWSTPGVVITPHTGDVRGWRGKVAELFCDNLARFLSDEPLYNLVDPNRGY